MVVYFIQRQSDNAIKIGHSTNIKCRYNTIKGRIKSDLEILCLIPGERNVEQSIHKKFNDIRIEREWFSPDTTLFEYIQSLQTEMLNINEVWNDIRLTLTTIQLSKETRETLKREIVIKGETYDTIINRILQQNSRYKELEERHNQLKDYCQQLESIIDPDRTKDF